MVWAEWYLKRLLSEMRYTTTSCGTWSAWVFLDNMTHFLKINLLVVNSGYKWVFCHIKKHTGNTQTHKCIYSRIWGWWYLTVSVQYWHDEINNSASVPLLYIHCVAPIPSCTHTLLLPLLCSAVFCYRDVPVPSGDSVTLGWHMLATVSKSTVVERLTSVECSSFTVANENTAVWAAYKHIKTLFHFLSKKYQG